MNKFFYNGLLDFYGALLTDKQQRICDAYFRDDLSLQEIAENEGISRSAVHDMIKRSKAELDNVEKKLGYYASYQKRSQIYDKIKVLGNKEINRLIDQCIETE